MRRLSAQYIITGTGRMLKRGVVTLNDDDTVASVHDTAGNLEESSGTEFYNGIIVPGFVNCHCHLELSHMQGAVKAGAGLAEFIKSVRETREASEAEILEAAMKADRSMSDEGVVACGDISNNTLTFNIKKTSPITYITFIEVFGIDGSKAEKRIAAALEVAAAAAAAGLHHHITPHAVYSVSRPLSDLLKKYISPASLISLHFLETAEETDLVSRRRGRLLESYKSLGVTTENLDIPDDHVSFATSLARQAEKLLLVHNTCISQDIFNILSAAENIFFCLCPSSNMYISGKMPPTDLLDKATGRVVIGTDSLASNNRLSILDELKLLQKHNRTLSLNSLISWATINGARALAIESHTGTIEPGKKPGILLIENTDLQELRLTDESRVRRLL